MKNLKEFGEELVDYLKDNLPTSIQEARIYLSNIIKNNGNERTAIVFRMPGEKIFPRIYVEDFYESYKNGSSIETCADHVLQLYLDDRLHRKEINIDKYEDIEWMKSHVTARLINASMNDLSATPHRLIAGGDIAVVYYIEDEDTKSLQSAKVNSELMSHLSLQECELYDLAMKNMENIPMVVMDLSHALCHMLRDSLENSVNHEDELETALQEVEAYMPEGRMYIISNPTGRFGATCILNTTFMDDLYDRVGNFLIIPSSIHECLIVPVEFNPSDTDYFNELINTVNQTSVPPEEVLSDKVYTYNRETHEVVYA